MARVILLNSLSILFCVAFAGVTLAGPAFGDALALISSTPRRVLADYPAEVSIPNTRRLEFVSKVNGHRYAINIAMPFEPATTKGYGVLYVLDGDMYFASAAEAVRGPDKAPGVVVVGIGYPDDPAFVQRVMSRRGPVAALFDALPPVRIAPYLERLYDLSLPASERALADMNQQGFPQYGRDNFGGLVDFLKTIETEVKPRVAALAQIDSGNFAIFGHSFGGFAVLHALFVEPNAFRTFIIASPSIFWNDKVVLAGKGKLAMAVNTGRANPRVLIAIGGEESTPPELPASWAMVENGRDLVAWLKTLRGDPSYVVEDYAVFDKTSHVYSPWPALARGISFAFSGRPIRKLDKDPGAVRRPSQ